MGAGRAKNRTPFAFKEMIRGVNLLPEAQEDIVSAYIWYETARPGLGDEFMNSLRESLIRILEYPSAHPAVGKGLRKARARRFPYQIFYRKKDGKIVVFAVHHDSRNPAEWKKRIH
jgi:plasmid stabilization system protein ParE